MKNESERGREVLEAALELIAERGIAGASLRRLAERLNLSQPSLYHYFKSKNELIDQLAEFGAKKMVEAIDLSQFPQLPPDAIPHYVKDRILELYRRESHVRYVKFLFVVAIESPRHRPVIHRVFEENLLKEPSREIQQLLAADPQFAVRLGEGLTMLARALGLALMEDLILFGLETPSERTLSHIEFVADSVTQLISGTQGE